jgi:hypothetical protein
VDQAKRLKELKRENAHPRKAVSDLTLNKLVLQEVLEAIWESLPFIAVLVGVLLLITDVPALTLTLANLVHAP